MKTKHQERHEELLKLFKVTKRALAPDLLDQVNYSLFGDLPISARRLASLKKEMISAYEQYEASRPRRKPSKLDALKSMVYTLGHAKSYRRGLRAQGKDFMKLGRNAFYPGGSVWKTPEEVFAYIKKRRLTDYSVWEVDADWKRDTKKNPNAEWRDLVPTSRITREVKFDKHGNRKP